MRGVQIFFTGRQEKICKPGGAGRHRTKRDVPESYTSPEEGSQAPGLVKRRPASGGLRSGHESHHSPSLSSSRTSTSRHLLVPGLQRADRIMVGLRAGLSGAVLFLICRSWTQVHAAELHRPCPSKHCRGTALRHGDSHFMVLYERGCL